MIYLILLVSAVYNFPILHHNQLKAEPSDSQGDELKWFSNKVDHFNSSDDREYLQRFWQNDQFFEPSKGIVFLYICGEGECAPRNVKEYAWQVAGQAKARLITIEHRYYGTSQPFADYSTENLKYLNSTQALADLAYFIDYMNTEIQTQYGVRAQWVCVGGSYPGALSAWFKAKYPNHVVAAWSSSGVINPIQNFEDFDSDIYIASQKSGIKCSQFIQNFTHQLDQAYFDSDTENIQLALTELAGFSEMRYDEFMFYVADIFTIGIQYGKRTDLCSRLEKLQNETFLNQLRALRQFADANSVTYDQYAYQNLTNITYEHSKNARQWTYQYCTEFGWFQVPNPKNAMRSKLLAPDFWLNYCQRVFEWPQIQPPAIEFYREYYGGLNIKGQNIFFMNANEDPWQYASIRKLDDEQAGMRSVLMECENCGHCIDLHTPSPNDHQNVIRAREQIANQIYLWLAQDRATFI